SAHVKANKLKMLAVASLEPFALTPGLPTMAASGLPGFEAIAIAGILAPGGTPPAIVNRLNQVIKQVLSKPTLKEKFLSSGVELIPSSPEQFGEKIKSEMAKWGKLLKDSGVNAEM